MSEPDVELRSVVAREHGLDERAARLLQGETVAELSESAIALGKLLGEQRHEQSAEHDPDARSQGDAISAALAATAAKKAALVEVFTGRAQRRDERGRFASSTGGFDGGAREGLPARPAETHDQTLARVLRTGEANVGGRGF